MNRENNLKNNFIRETFITLQLAKTTVGTFFFFPSEPKFRGLVYPALALTDPPFVAK